MAISGMQPTRDLRLSMELQHRHQDIWDTLNRVTGTSGTSGRTGTSGTSGHNGTSGADGTSGRNGTSGINGASGTNGVSGTSGISGSTGTSGTNGSSGTAGSSGTSAVCYIGEMYQQGNAAATTTGTAGVWYQIANFGAGTLSGATFGTNGIAVTNAGTYQISGSFDGTVTDNSDAVAFSIAVNGTAGGLLPKNNLYRALVPNQTAVRFSGAVNGYLVLAANDVVKLIGTCTNAAHNFTVANANVTLSSP